MEKSRSLSRQPSASSLRHGCSVRYILTSGPCRFLMCVGFLFSAGVLCGVYLGDHLLPARLSLYSQQPAHDVEEKADEGKHRLSLETRPPTLAMAQKTEKQDGHKPSVKKDVSKQVRDYIPRHVFIDISLGPPSSIELFLETYPNAQKYTFYAFQADASYKALYAKFPNIYLYPGTVPSTTQNNITMKIPGRNQTFPISTLNFPDWLKETVHFDEYVVVKMTADPDTEEEIIRLLVISEALEWIDKYYTTTEDGDLFEIIKERFSTKDREVFSWDDEKYTYTDFDKVNPPPAQREEQVKITECIHTNDSYFAVLLYFSTANKYSSATLNLLQKLSHARSSKLPLTLFLPLEHLDRHSFCRVLPASLGKQVDLGLYLQDNSFSTVKAEDDETHENLIRNMLVSAEHCFEQGNITLDIILSKSEMLKTEALQSGKKDKKMRDNDSPVKKLISNRKYAIISNVQDVTPMTGQTTIDFQSVVSQCAKRALLAIDVSVKGTDVAVLQLLTSYTSFLIPMQVCLEQAA